MTSIVDDSNYLFTSESVTEGHPDKMCDQISDAILDAILAGDRDARVACETATTTGVVMVMGEITTDIYVDFQQVIRDTVERIGYTDDRFGFDYRTCGCLVSVHEQSPDIKRGVDNALETRGRSDLRDQGAGDQGMMFGYACTETPELMPLPITLAHRLTKRMADVRRRGEIGYLRPDGKSQVTVEYDKGVPVAVRTVVLAAQHDDDVSNDRLRDDLIQMVVEPVIPEALRVVDPRLLVNPTGRFVVGGPMGDAGLTGRKIIVDTYGGAAPHGGGAFSGKDPSKVDRSAAYAGRYVAKNVVAAGLASKCLVQVAYAIGVAKPVSVMVDTFGTGKMSDDALSKLVATTFDLRPKAIIQTLNMLRPIYQKTAAYGHFGREEPEFTWEMTDKALALKQAA